MSDAPDAACPAYDALANGPGTLARAQALQEKIDPHDADTIGPGREEESRVVPTREGRKSATAEVASSGITLPAPVREPPSRIYQRVQEELSQFVAPETAEEILDRALHDIGADRSAASTLDFREALVEIIPDRLAVLLPEANVEPVLWALENALVDIHRSGS